MSSTASLVEHIVDSFRADVIAKKMFGEYGLYKGEVMFGLVCDDRLFIKDTAAGRALLDEVIEGAPYPGAKPALVIDEGLWSDHALLRRLLEVTVAALPAKKAKKAKATTKTATQKKPR